MTKMWKRAAGIVMAAALSLTFVLSSGNVVMAEEGDASGGEEEVLGAGSYKVGDIIKFGHYEQDGNTANGKEEIEWQVIKAEGGRVLVLSKYILDCKTYHDTSGAVTWETSALRKWLNNDFKNAAFTSAEQSIIPTVTLVNKDNAYYGTPGGKDTKDQVFCLSTDEVEELIGYNVYDDKDMEGASHKLLAQVTRYAISRGSTEEEIGEGSYEYMLKDEGYPRDVIGLRTSSWWLRSPGMKPDWACQVNHFGHAGPGISIWCDNSFEIGMSVRPALYINVYPESIKLDKTSADLYYGDSLKLSATVKPSDVMDKTVTWTSNYPDVATVDGSGTVKATGKRSGIATITAKTVNGLTAKCEVTVYADNNPSNIFADIKYGNWKYDAAKSVYDKGYMTGTGNLHGRIVFSPDTDINRSQFVVSLYSMAGKPEVTYKQKFSDVKDGDWYAKAVSWASGNGIVAGKGNKFDVNGQATREQLALMFYKYAKYKNYDVSIKPSTNLDKFTDASKVDSWALTAVKWAVERGIISGKGSAESGYRIDPLKGATRAECAAMMNKFAEGYAGGEKAAFEDVEEPLALPMEEMEEAPLPEEEMEDIIDDGDIIPDDEGDVDIEDMDSGKEDESDGDN